MPTHWSSRTPRCWSIRVYSIKLLVLLRLLPQQSCLIFPERCCKGAAITFRISLLMLMLLLRWQHMHTWCGRTIHTKRYGANQYCFASMKDNPKTVFLIILLLYNVQHELHLYHPYTSPERRKRNEGGTKKGNQAIWEPSKEIKRRVLR